MICRPYAKNQKRRVCRYQHPGFGGGAFLKFFRALDNRRHQINIGHHDFAIVVDVERAEIFQSCDLGVIGVGFGSLRADFFDGLRELVLGIDERPTVEKDGAGAPDFGLDSHGNSFRTSIVLRGRMSAREL